MTQLLTPSWHFTKFGSGTCTVAPPKVHTSYFHIGHVPHDDEGQNIRSRVSNDLADWLNGGAEPAWLPHIHRKGPDTIILPNKCEIRATGPMIDTATPPSWGCWKEDTSDDAVISRGLLINAIMRGERPEVPKYSPPPRTR